MRKNYLFLSVIAAFIFSCNRVEEAQSYEISNLADDFTVSDSVELQHVNNYAIFTRVERCLVDDSVLWAIVGFDQSIDNFGNCFNINSGEKLSIIANRGKASNECLEIYDAKIVGDSIQFESREAQIITFAKKDIVDNKPMSERNFSLLMPRDSIFTDRKIKLKNGSVLATLSGFRSAGQYVAGYYSDRVSEFNKGLIAVIDNKEAKSYRPLDLDKLKVNKIAGLDMTELKPRMRAEFSSSNIGINDNKNKAVFSLTGQLILYTFDLNSRKLSNKKIYTVPNIGNVGNSFSNDMRIRTLDMKCTDEYIICYVRGYLSAEDRAAAKIKHAVLIYDWDLNPVKRINIINGKGSRNFISEDCSAVYFWELTGDGISLSKADLKY